jgi:hypothetical protein
MGLPFLLLLGGGRANPAAVTLTGGEVYGRLAVEPTAAATLTAGEVYAAMADPVAAVTQIVAEIFGRRPETTFANAELAIGLTWLELTRPSDMP